MTNHTLLVGDAGGTNVRFALARISDGAITLSDIWKRPGADYPSFEDALGAWLDEVKPKLAGASFGLAGQVVDDRVDLLNRGWSVDLAAVRTKLGLKQIVVVNDFVAMARAAPELGPADASEIAPGKADPAGSLAIGGPGTGFGIGVLRRYSGRQGAKNLEGWVVVGGEGGHQAFVPLTETEWKLAELLRQRLGYVSNEIVAAGAGFEATRDALADIMHQPHRDLSQRDVTDLANAGDAFAVEFCRIRAACVMTAMGNLALSANATGGVFIAGGVAVHLEPWLKERPALDRFYARGARAEMVRNIPIKLITTQTAPLIGSARLWLDERERGWL